VIALIKQQVDTVTHEHPEIMARISAPDGRWRKRARSQVSRWRMMSMSSGQQTISTAKPQSSSLGNPLRLRSSYGN
jgi:hypothetical protein